MINGDLTARYFKWASLSLLVSLSACGMIGIGADQGLFGQEYVASTLSRPNDLQGTWELEDGYSSTNSSAFQQTYGYTITKTRIRVDSPSTTLIKFTTVCERRDQNNVNKIVSTYVNADAWVLIEPTGAVTSTTTAGTSGRITVNSFRNTDITGNKEYGCVPNLETGVYAYQVLDGRLFLDLVQSINLNGQVAQTANVTGRASYRKLRD